jgi:hypothetical protein
MPTSEEKLEELLKDLHELAAYLHARGERTLNLSRQFEAHAKQDPANREFDVNQARMLSYQHDIWHEIGNMLEKVMKRYEQ